MSNLRERLKISEERLREVNDFILDPENELINSLLEVVEKYGWEGLTTKNLKTAMNQVKDFLPWGGLGKITYTEKRPAPVHMRMYQSKKGKLLPVSDWGEVPDFLPAE